MRKLPMNSEERTVDTIKNKDKSNAGAPPVSTKAKLILKIILISLSVVVGTAICTTVLYYGFLKKSDDEKTSNTNNVSGTEKLKSFKKNK